MSLAADGSRVAPRRFVGRRVSTSILKALNAAGVVGAVHRIWRHRLTVLAYHRIADPDADGRDTLRANISATPLAFASQMDFLRRRFDVISLADLHAWLRGRGPMPPYPALITFDDGYRDNLDNAFPILRARALPAVLFVATDCTRPGASFYWDQAAYCFRHTRLQEAVLPIVGHRAWTDEADRQSVLSEWLDTAKRLPDERILAAAADLRSALSVTIPSEAFTGLHLSWDRLRQLQRGGVDICAHTRSHAILTRVSEEQARAEIAGSRALIEAELQSRVTAFAYPNGGPDDFDESHVALLRSLGFETAFTLLDGPQSLGAVRRNPLAIRRLFIGHRDDLRRFAVKASGTRRLLGIASRLSSDPYSDAGVRPT